jgi:hypothetical protein
MKQEKNRQFRITCEKFLCRSKPLRVRKLPPGLNESAIFNKPFGALVK